MPHETTPLAKAALIDVESLDRLIVRWNPRSYRLERRAPARREAIGAVGLPPAPGGDVDVDEVFSARLLLDSTEEEGAARDLRAWTGRLDRWLPPPSSAAPRGREVLFAWGPFSFQGRLLSRDEEWVLFDPDGTPVRAWVDIVLGR